MTGAGALTPPTRPTDEDVPRVEPEAPTLPEAAVAVLRRWRTVLAVALPIALLVLGYAQSLPTTWSATATVAFSPRAEVAVGADTVALVVPSYVAFLTSAGRPRRRRPPARDDRRRPRPARRRQRPADHRHPRRRRHRPRTATSSPGAANALARAAAGRAGADPIVGAAVVSAAVPPTVPGRTRRGGCCRSSALLAALLAGTGRRRCARPRSSPASAAALLDVPGGVLLGRLPTTDALLHPAAEALEEPEVGVVVRALRDRLVGLAAPAPVLVLAVCSASRREGRTTVAALVAQSFARLGSSVLLVDADLSGHGLTDEYAWGLPAGDLVDLLEGEPLAGLVEPTGLPGLSLLAAGRADEPDDLFARQLSVLGHALREHRPALVAAGSVADDAAPAPAAVGYDVVVLDTPALLDHDEAVLLARLADGVLLVAADGRPSGPLHEAHGLLVAAGARPLGVVVNRGVRRRRRRLGSRL